MFPIGDELDMGIVKIDILLYNLRINIVVMYVFDAKMWSSFKSCLLLCQVTITLRNSWEDRKMLLDDTRTIRFSEIHQFFLEMYYQKTELMTYYSRQQFVQRYSRIQNSVSGTKIQLDRCDEYEYVLEVARYSEGHRK